MRILIAAMLLVLLAPLAGALARAETTPHPMSGVTLNDAPSKHLGEAIGRGWSSTERFIWSCLSSGQEANFNTEQDKQLSCIAPLTFHKNRFARKHHICGIERDSEEFFKANAHRIVSAKFIAELIDDKSLREKIGSRGIRIKGAIFLKSNSTKLPKIERRKGHHHKVALQSRRFPFDLVLDDSIFVGGLDLDNASLEKNLSVDNSTMCHPFRVQRAKVAGAVFMSNGVFGRIRFNSSTFGKDILASKSLIFYGFEIMGSKLGATLDLAWSKQTHLLIINSAIDGDVVLRVADIRCSLQFVGGRIGGDLRFVHTEFGSNGVANQVKQNETGYAWWPSFDHPRTARRYLEHDVASYRRRAASNLPTCKIKPGRTQPIRDIKVANMEIGGNLCFFNTIDLAAQKVIQVPRHVRMRSVDVDGALILNWQSKKFQDVSATMWGLLDVKARSFVSDLERWPAQFGLHLSNFANVALDSRSCIGDPPQTGAGDELEKSIVSWISANRWSSVQTYTNFAEALERMGHTSTDLKVAREDLKYALVLEQLTRQFKDKPAAERRPEETTRASTYGVWSPLYLGMLNLYSILVAYGHKPFQIVGWIVIAVGAFAIVVHMFEGKANGRHENGAKGDDDPLGLHSPIASLFYALDTFIPIINLEDAHASYRPQSTIVRRWLYAHKFLGYLFTSFLLAGIAGLTP